VVTPRHEFLAALHEAFRPATYLEIGVQFGHSLRLTLPTTQAVGIDPEPLCTPPPNAKIFAMKAGEFFAEIRHPVIDDGIDFAFIDGMHLVEAALRDLINCETYADPAGIIVLDDVLPYSADIAHREPLPGDWAGDVWKLWPILTKWRQDLKITMVDVEPTGLMVIQRLDPLEGPQLLNGYYDTIVDTWAVEVDRADEWFEQIRQHAHKPDTALRIIKGE
jgi:hypothetical protein